MLPAMPEPGLPWISQWKPNVPVLLKGTCKVQASVLAAPLENSPPVSETTLWKPPALVNVTVSPWLMVSVEG